MRKLKFLNSFKKITIIFPIQVNRNNLFLWKISIFSKTRIRLTLIYILKVWLNRKYLDLHIHFWIQSVTAYFYWRIWRKSGHKEVWIWKGKNIIIVFSNNFEYSSLILYQNSRSGSFLKLKCRICKLISDVTLKSIYLSCS